MTRKQLYREVAAYFRQAMPEAKTELHYDNPFQLLVAVIFLQHIHDSSFMIYGKILKIFKNLNKCPKNGKIEMMFTKRKVWEMKKHKQLLIN